MRSPSLSMAAASLLPYSSSSSSAPCKPTAPHPYLESFRLIEQFMPAGYAARDRSIVDKMMSTPPSAWRARSSPLCPHVFAFAPDWPDRLRSLARKDVEVVVANTVTLHRFCLRMGRHLPSACSNTLLACWARGQCILDGKQAHKKNQGFHLEQGAQQV